MAKKEMLEVWTLLTAQYHDHIKQFSQDQYEKMFHLYEQLLSDIDGKVLKAAAMKHIRECKWFPKVSELCDAAFSMLEAGIPTAEEAWSEVANEMRRVGYYGDPKFTHQSVYDAVNTFGWENLCSAEDHAVLRAHFYRTYDSFVKRAKDDMRMLPEVRNVIKQLQAPKEHQLRAVSGGFKRATE